LGVATKGVLNEPLLGRRPRTRRKTTGEVPNVEKERSREPKGKKSNANEIASTTRPRKIYMAKSRQPTADDQTEIWRKKTRDRKREMLPRVPGKKGSATFSWGAGEERSQDYKRRTPKGKVDFDTEKREGMRGQLTGSQKLNLGSQCRKTETGENSRRAPFPFLEKGGEGKGLRMEET